MLKVDHDFLIDNLLVRIHLIIVMIRWTGLAPWEFDFPFPGSLASTFLVIELSWAPHQIHLDVDGRLICTGYSALKLRMRSADIVGQSEVLACITICHCEDRIGTGPPRARTEVIYVDLGYRAISGSVLRVIRGVAFTSM